MSVQKTITNKQQQPLIPPSKGEDISANRTAAIKLWFTPNKIFDGDVASN